MIRCRNCGDLHKTNECSKYGPWFPEPGKTASSYLEETTRIAALVAADILEEHEGHGHGEGTDRAAPDGGAGREGSEPEAGSEVRGPGSGDGEVEPG